MVCCAFRTEVLGSPAAMSLSSNGAKDAAFWELPSLETDALPELPCREWPTCYGMGVGKAQPKLPQFEKTLKGHLAKSSSKGWLGTLL